MDPKIKARWVRALRNPKRYTKTKFRLHRSKSGGRDAPAGYCCLGVLTDLAVKSGVEIHGTIGGDWSSMAILPPEVVEWAGLDESNPIVKDGVGREACLVDFNDGDNDGVIHARSFGQIASYIEKSL